MKEEKGKCILCKKMVMEQEMREYYVDMNYYCINCLRATYKVDRRRENIREFWRLMFLGKEEGIMLCVTSVW